MRAPLNRGIRPLACLFAVALSATVAYAAPKIKSDSPTIDLGTIDAGETVTRTFTIINEGDKPLLVESLNPSWNAADLPRPSIDKNTLNPGESAKITTPFRSTGNGKFAQTVQVRSNDPNTPNYQLTLTGTLQLPLMLEPARVEFGTFNVADAPSKSVSIRPKDAKVKFQIRSISAANFLDVQSKPQPDGVGYELVITPRKDTLQGNFSGTIVVSTDQAAFSTISIPYAAKPQSDIIAKGKTSGILVITRDKDGVGHSTDFLLTGAKPEVTFAVTGNSPPASIKVSAEKLAGDWTIGMKDIPKNLDLQGKFLTVATDLPSMRSVRIPISDPLGRTATLEWGPVLSGLQMAVQPPTQTYTSKQNFSLTVYIRNVTDKPAKVLTPTAADFLYEGVRPNATPIELNDAARTRLAATRPAATTDIAPGTLRQFSITPRTYIDFSRDGTYRLKARLLLGPANGPETTTLVSNEISVQIKNPPPPLPEGLP